MVTANAASVGDVLLGVPLLCSSGLPAEAAAVLQEGGLWRYAATLAAQLPPSAAAITLDSWAGHVHEVPCSCSLPVPTFPNTMFGSPSKRPATVILDPESNRIEYGSIA